MLFTKFICIFANGFVVTPAARAKILSVHTRMLPKGAILSYMEDEI